MRNSSNRREKSTEMVEHVYQDADGEEVTERIPASQASQVPNRDAPPIVTTPEAQAAQKGQDEAV